MNFSNKNMNITSSLTLEIDAKAKSMKSQGIDVIGFGAGEPDFPTPSYIIEAAKNALDKGYTKYTPSSGLLELRESISNKILKDNDINYKPTEILVSNGAKHSLFNAFQAILNPGDEVIIPSPYWVSYPEIVRMADGIPVFVDTFESDNFEIHIDALKKAINKNTKAIIINSPNNPCGSVYSKETLEKIAELTISNDIFVVSDEIYEELVYDNTEHVSIASLGKEIQEKTLLINGLSKAYAMTGWRIGYTAGNQKIIDIMSNIQSHSTSNPNSIAQYASLVAINSPKDEIYKMVKEFDKRREYMVDKINKISGISCILPKGAFYILMNIKSNFKKFYEEKEILGSLDFANALLESQKVAVVPGVAFGADEYVRLSYATSLENIIDGLDKIEQFILKLK